MDAVQSGWISSIGKYVTRFEDEFASFCRVSYAVATSNGTAALHLSLKAYGIGEGDEVIMPDLSFIATANAVLMTGAKPVFCDIEAETLCINPELIEEKITSSTKAIIPVHLYGHPANMQAIMKLARARNLYVIEDAAEAHGAEIHGQRVGGFGDCATFSFYGNKNLTTGEGGMITSNDTDFIERCRMLRDHAMSSNKRYWHDELGFNYRLTNLQAALGCAQLERASELLAARRHNFEMYKARLGGCQGLRLNRTMDWALNSYWMVCLEVEGMDEVKRATLMTRLIQVGVDTRPYFYPMSKMPYLPDADTPISHHISQIGINLPTYVGLEEADIDYISEQVLRVVGEVKNHND